MDYDESTGGWLVEHQGETLYFVSLHEAEQFMDIREQRSTEDKYQFAVTIVAFGLAGFAITLMAAWCWM
mgnify:CR=1 FL=1